MRPLDFPNYPTQGQIWGRHRWDGVKWTFAPLVAAEPQVGEIIDWPSDDTPPAGWAVLDGRTVERWRYPTLFALFGTRFGAPSSRTFNMPDLRGKLLVGLDPDGSGRITVADVTRMWEEIGSELAGEHDHTAIGGAHDHTHNNPTHTHGITQSAHTHGFSDPWHGHGTTQSVHSHGNADPTHTHGKPDPTHTHTQGHTWGGRAPVWEINWYQFIVGGHVGTDHRGSEMWNDG